MKDISSTPQCFKMGLTWVRGPFLAGTIPEVLMFFIMDFNKFIMIFTTLIEGNILLSTLKYQSLWQRIKDGMIVRKAAIFSKEDS